MCNQYDNRGCEVVDEITDTVNDLEANIIDLQFEILGYKTKIADLKTDIVNDLKINFFVHASTNLGTTKDRAKILMMKWEVK